MQVLASRSTIFEPCLEAVVVVAAAVAQGEPRGLFSLLPRSNLLLSRPTQKPYPIILFS